MTRIGLEPLARAIATVRALVGGIHQQQEQFGDLGSGLGALHSRLSLAMSAVLGERLAEGCQQLVPCRTTSAHHS